ncbi:hypothetical protein MMC29_001710 [Sticta canariensis]|nr:hypothetical protein [Sticta canariensis]
MSGSSLLSYAGWTFLPNLVTGWIQALYYGITIRAGDRKPQPGEPRYNRHRRRIHMTVVIAYLLYTIYETDYLMRRESDFYQDLGLNLDADEKKIKSKFRRLAAIHHPDKVVAAENRYNVESFFVNLKVAQDTLIDPVKRFAYERFGPDMLKWQHCSSNRDYLIVGLQAAIPLYVGSIILLVIFGVLGYLQWGRFWRYLTFLALFVLEYHTLTRPYLPHILSKFINPLLSLTTHPPMLPFQFLILARKITFSLFIAASQLGSFQPATPPPAASSGVPSVVESQQLTRLEQLAQASEVEASRLLALDMSPFVGDEAGVKELRGRVREWLVTNTIRADPEVRDAMGRVLAKKRVGAPPGARETNWI